MRINQSINKISQSITSKIKIGDSGWARMVQSKFWSLSQAGVVLCSGFFILLIISTVCAAIEPDDTDGFKSEVISVRQGVGPLDFIFDQWCHSITRSG
jgi:hypothetical protein